MPFIRDIPRKSAVRARLIAVAVLLLPLALPAAAQMSHTRGGAAACAEPTLACATSATPTFGPDGALWLAWAAAGQVWVARSRDLGRSFTPAVAVNPAPARLDNGPDARPQIVIDRAGRITVAYAIFKDSAYNGAVFTARSADGGASFTPPQPITADAASQRFAALALDTQGSLFAAWLDKRNAVAARAKGQTYVGAALAFAWSNADGTRFAQTRIAQDNTCECCRLGVAFAAPGRPAVLFRNVFGGTVRDHAVTTFADPFTPGPIYRVSVDDWAIDACPHHGPALAISPAGTYHAAWFTNGRARKGVFYARSANGGRSFSAPMPIGSADRAPGRPALVALAGAVWLAWKEFDGDQTAVTIMVSHDDGATWSTPQTIARTSEASDHPLLVSDGRRAFLSWQTRADGYRLFPLEDSP
jgi:hypothetical protein